MRPYTHHTHIIIRAHTSMRTCSARLRVHRYACWMRIYTSHTRTYTLMPTHGCTFTRASHANAHIHMCVHGRGTMRTQHAYTLEHVYMHDLYTTRTQHPRIRVYTFGHARLCPYTSATPTYICTYAHVICALDARHTQTHMYLTR